MNLISQPNVITHQPIIKLNSNPDLKKSDPVLTVHDDRVYYLSSDCLFSLDYESKEWKSEGEPQFKADYGFSMTSTPSGLVFFGGCRENDSNFVSDLYIYSFEHWLAHTHNASPRCWHAATWVASLSSLLISGGYSPKGIKDDFILLDITSGLTRQLPLQIPLPFAFHSITVINPTWVCLYGGQFQDGRQNNNVFLINVHNGKVEKLDDFPFFQPRYRHRAFNFYGNLLVSGGYNISSPKAINGNSKTQPKNVGVPVNSIILLVFLHRVWLMCPIPEQLSKVMTDTSYALLLSKGLMLINKDGSQSSVLYFNDTKEPFFGPKDPKYIGFLNNLLSQNLHSQNSDPYESPYETRRLQLLEERRQIYQQLSEKTGNKSLSPLYNERDCLTLLLSRFSRSELIKRAKPAPVSNEQPQTYDPSLVQKTMDQLNRNFAEFAKLEELLKKEANITISLFSGIEKSIQSATSNVQESKQGEETLRKASIKDLKSLKAQYNQLSSEYALTKETLQNYVNMKNVNSIMIQIDVDAKIDSLAADLHAKKTKKIELQRQYMDNMVKLIDQMTQISQFRKPDDQQLQNYEKEIEAAYDQLNTNKLVAKTFHYQYSDLISQTKSKLNYISNVSNFKSKDEMKVQIAQALASLSSLSKTFNKYSHTTDSGVSFPNVDVKDQTNLLTKKAQKISSQNNINLSNSEDNIWAEFYSVCENTLSEINIINK